MLLNADVGEGLVSDLQLYPYLDQANIACGGHTGNKQSMQQAVAACIEHKVVLGAHPSYPDTNNFGRLSIDIAPTELAQSLQQQIQSLIKVCDSSAITLSYIKPHGALYNDMMVQVNLFELVVDIVANQVNDLDLMLGAGLSNNDISKAKRMGVNIIREAFVDRQYLSSGQLMPRTDNGAIFNTTEKICSQVTNLKAGSVKDEQGNLIKLEAESICLHGDNPASVNAVQSVAQLLNKPLLKK